VSSIHVRRQVFDQNAKTTKAAPAMTNKSKFTIEQEEQTRQASERKRKADEEAKESFELKKKNRLCT
jgi:hypothetical protein